MNYSVKQWLSKFTSRKDAINAVDEVIHELESYHAYENIEDRIVDWYKFKKEIESFESIDLAQQVLDFLNQQYGTQYKNAEKIKAVIRQVPKATFDQFASIIMHKKETWGPDPKMRDYLRPATLFGSKNKFQIYLEDATHYWIKKQTNDSKGKV